MKIHQIKTDFNVTETIKRFVYFYIVESENIYLIDSGVYGSEDIICSYLKSIGRSMDEIKGIFLTHAHPDHVGTAAWFRENTGCRVYASQGEAPWIEDIDLQFRERPIPNFYSLAGKSCAVDTEVKDGDIIRLEDNLEVKVIGTAGHSADEVSYLVNDSLFTGDTIPVKGDIPIYVNVEDTLKSLDIIDSLEGIDTFYPAWDRAYSKDEIRLKTDEAREIISSIDKCVLEKGKDKDLNELIEYICGKLNMPGLKENRLFAQTVLSHIVYCNLGRTSGTS